MRFTCAAYDRDSGLVVDPLRATLEERFLDPRWSVLVSTLSCLLCSLLSLLFGCWEDFLCFVDVDQRWLEFLGSDHDHGDHLLSFFLGCVHDAFN
jgi:hypothetical protein